MFVRIIIITILSHIFTQQCTGIRLIDLPETDDEVNVNRNEGFVEPRRLRSKKYHHPNAALRSTTTVDLRRWLLRQRSMPTLPTNNFNDKPIHYEDEKDENIKSKIATLVKQTLHDTERKIKSVQYIKDKYIELAPYKAGFILSMIKKSRDVLNELFNVAVKHRDEWKALEQLKIFELIVHTNVDTTNLVRQMVEIHIQHLNSTNNVNTDKKRVVLI